MFPLPQGNGAYKDDKGTQRTSDANFHLLLVKESLVLRVFFISKYPTLLYPTLSLSVAFDRDEAPIGTQLPSSCHPL